MSFDVVIWRIGEKMEAFPVAQFSCRALSMPVKLICNILGKRWYFFLIVVSLVL